MTVGRARSVRTVDDGSPHPSGQMTGAPYAAARTEGNGVGVRADEDGVRFKPRWRAARWSGLLNRAAGALGAGMLTRSVSVVSRREFLPTWTGPSWWRG